MTKNINIQKNSVFPLKTRKKKIVYNSNFKKDRSVDIVKKNINPPVVIAEESSSTYFVNEKQKYNTVAKNIHLKSIFEQSLIGQPLHHFFIPNPAIHRLTIRVASNNIFCTLKNMDTNTMFYAVSSGSYKTTVTKRSIRKNTKDIIESFFKDLQEKNFNYTHPIAINLIAPSSFKKFILEILETQVLSKINMDNFCYIDVNSKKKFNGCRTKKLLRKKRMSLFGLI